MSNHRLRSAHLPRRRFVVLAVATFALPFSGFACFNGPLPARELYRLTVAPMPETAPTPGPLQGTIEVARYDTPGLYGDGNIVFRTGDNEYGVYPSREWGIPLGQMLGVLAEGAIERNPLTTDGAVYDAPPGHDAPYIWRGMVREFEEINRGKEVFVAVRLDAQLVRTADDAILWKGSRRLERPVLKPTMPAIVAELSALATEVTESLISDARAALAVQGTNPAASSQSPR